MFPVIISAVLPLGFANATLVSFLCQPFKILINKIFETCIKILLEAVGKGGS